MEKMVGFYMWLNGKFGTKDVFIETQRKNKTEKFAKQILEKLNIPPSDGAVKETLNRLETATCEICGAWYNIEGNNFSCGYKVDGSDGETIIINNL